MFNFKSSVHHLSLAVVRHARLFQGDQRGSISILGAVFIALLLGIGTVAMRVGDSYVEKLREFRTADIAAHAITKTANGPGGLQAVIDMLGGMNGTKLGLITIFRRNGRTVYHFPCGIEVEI